jgi:hypothetical protein
MRRAESVQWAEKRSYAPATNELSSTYTVRPPLVTIIVAN